MAKKNALPKLPSLSRKSVANRPCQCNCGRKCHNMFAPGHDARLKSGVIALVEGKMTLAAITETMGAPYAKAVVDTLSNAERLTAWGIDVEAAAEAKTA